jgi:uncharacterized metal-binding protein YceD (DUF177 family)
MSPFIILIDRLRGGQTQAINESLPPDVLGPNEPELVFAFPVQVKGEAYLTDDHLIIHLAARTKISMPCAICNKMIDQELKVDNFYHTEPLENIRSASFDFSEALREALLIELPRTVECNGGNCPDRDSIKPFLKESREETYHPFADIEDLKQEN